LMIGLSIVPWANARFPPRLDRQAVD
jgi:hypothetical protein